MAQVPRSTRLELAALRQRDNWRNFLYLGADWLLIVAAAAACVITGFSPLVYLPALVLIGSRQRALMNLVHQASHGKLFRAPRLNEWAAKLLAAFPVATSLSAYTCAHCRHHGSLWSETDDPKTIRYGELGLIEPMADGSRRFWLRHLVSPVLLRHAPYNVVSAIRSEGEDRSETVQRAGFWAIVAAGAVLGGFGWELLLLWVVPYCTTFQVIRYLGEMAEHAGLQSDDPWMSTRNWKGGLVARFLLSPHSDHYHLTHHLCPAVPHFRLRRAHQILMGVPQYAAGHHCDGYFLPRGSLPTVIADIRNPRRRSRVAPATGRRGWSRGLGMAIPMTSSGDSGSPD